MKIKINDKYSLDNEKINKVKKVTKAAFNKRRKMLRNSLKNYLPDDREGCPIDLRLRPAKLKVDQYIELTEWIDENTDKLG